MKSTFKLTYIFAMALSLTISAIICELLGLPGLQAPIAVAIALVFRDDMVYIGKMIVSCDFNKESEEELFRKEWIRNSEFVTPYSVGRRGLSPAFFDKNKDIIEELTKNRRNINE